ncbi:MAG: hypothetical protein R3B70_37755 [Polyangiaceae bacterium]
MSAQDDQRGDRRDFDAGEGYSLREESSATFFDDEPDTFDSEERARIDAAITAGKDAAACGEVFMVEHVLSEI